MEDFKQFQYFKSTFEVNGKKINRLHFPVITSTQTYSKVLCKSQPITEYILVSTDKQLAGVGTHKRKWVSDIIGNCYITLITPNSPLESKTHLFHQAAIPSMAVIDSIKEELKINDIERKVEIKWPNDVLLEGKKICGILPEFLGENCEKDKVNIVLGVGVNINMPQEILDTIDQPVNSLSASTGLILSVETFIRRFLENYFNLLEKYSGNEGLISFHKDYLEKSAFMKDKVKVKDDTDEKFYEGFIKDITPEGVLVLDIDGNTREFKPGNGILRKVE